jgi:hypothetical protein
MRYKKRFKNFGKVLLIIVLAIFIIIRLVTIEIWLTNWLGFTGYALSMVFRLLGLSFIGLVTMKMFK